MDAQTLLKQAARAIRDENNPQQGQALLRQALELDPELDMAWLWLTRTTADPQQQLEFVERALAINPTNEHALKLKARLAGVSQPVQQALVRPPSGSSTGSVIRPLAPMGAGALTASDQARLKTLLDQAEAAHKSGKLEAALAGWQAVLEIQVDHELAIQRVVSHLWRTQRAIEAREIVWRALESGTTTTTIWLTALDIAERMNDQQQADFLRRKIVQMSNIEDSRIVVLLDRYLNSFQVALAAQFAHLAGEARPTSQEVLLKVGDVLQRVGHEEEAKQYLSQAMELGLHTKAGRQADNLLLDYVPELTETERTSVWLAVREVVGIGLLYLMMGWQDAGLNLLHMGVTRWLGVLLAFVGGYLVVSATSSPHQRMLRWLVKTQAASGGNVRSGAIVPLTSLDASSAGPDETVFTLPLSARVLLGLVGGIILVFAFALVFFQALELAF